MGGYRGGVGINGRSSMDGYRGGVGIILVDVVIGIIVVVFFVIGLVVITVVTRIAAVFVLGLLFNQTGHVFVGGVVVIVVINARNPREIVVPLNPLRWSGFAVLDSVEELHHACKNRGEVVSEDGVW